MSNDSQTELPAIDLDRIRAEEFAAASKWTYFNHASDSPLPARSARVLRERVALLEDPQLVVPAREKYLDRAQEYLGRLIGGLSDQIAFLTNTSDATSVVVNGLEWQAGDEVIVVSGEFASFVYPWKTLERIGVVVRVVAKDGVETRTEDIEAVISARTRVLAISHVDYRSGFQNDLRALGALCREHNMLFVVDASQSLGVIPVDAEVNGIDVLVAVGYKWLMSPHGISVLYVSPDAMQQIHPSAPGRYSIQSGWQSVDYALNWFPDARRYQGGALNWMGVCALAESTGLLDEIGLEQVTAASRAISDSFIARAADLPIQLTSDLREEHRSTILTFTFGSEDRDEDFVEYAAKQDVPVGRRAFGVRFSSFFWNTDADLDRFTGLIRAFSDQVARPGGKT